MAPFDIPPTGNLNTRISSLIDGQLPDFIQADHPQFSKFLQAYYQFMEAAELQLTVNISNILLEKETNSSLLYEDSSLIVTESGDGTDGKFLAGEVITGNTSKATAIVLVDDLGNTKPRLFIQSQQKFQTGEVVVGSASSAQGTIIRYRANPIQNINQLLDYADVDNTIYDFLEDFRESFMNAIPNKLAVGIDKRNIIKNIRELYRIKGTKEGHKLFLRILLGEESEILYPNRYMLNVSGGDWLENTIIKVSPIGLAIASEIQGQMITGEVSGATAVVESTATFLQASRAVVEIIIKNDTQKGTFIKDEVVSATSSLQDVLYKFNVRQIINDATIINDGILYSQFDPIDVDDSVAIGNGIVSARVGEVGYGSVSDVFIQTEGTGYRPGDPLVFTNPQSTTETAVAAKAHVSVVNGSIISEESELLIQENGTASAEKLFDLQIENGTYGAGPYYTYATDTNYSNNKGYYWPLYLSKEFLIREELTSATAKINGSTINSTTVNIDDVSGTVTLDQIVTGVGITGTVTVQSIISDTQITISHPFTLADNVVLSFNKIEINPAGNGTLYHEHEFLEYPGVTFYMPWDENNHAGQSIAAVTATLEFYGQGKIHSESGNVATGMATPASSNTETVLGDRLTTEIGEFYIEKDGYSDRDSFALESGNGEITKIHVTEPGYGYSTLPTATVSSEKGTGTAVYAKTTDIGRVKSLDITDEGFDYSDVPVIEFRAKFIMKDVTGTWISGDALTTHTGTVRSYDAERQILDVSIEDVIRIDSEGTTGEGIRVEDSLLQLDENNLRIDGEITVEERLKLETGDNIYVPPVFNILADAIDVPDRGYIVVLDDFGVEYDLVMESVNLRDEYADILTEQNEVLKQEDGTTSQNTFGDRFIFETDDIKDESAINYEINETKIVFEDQNVDYRVGVNDFFITNGHLVTDHILLLENSTISEPNYILLNSTDGSADGNGNLIVINSTDANGTDANESLLGDIDDFDNIAMDGLLVNSETGAVQDGAIGDQVLLEGKIDFSNAVITESNGASGTVVAFDIATANLNLGIAAARIGSYGSRVSSLLGEDLIRIQDSFYYQDFSYEIQADSSADSYINEFKKAVHPTGFNVFSKVSTSSLVSAAMVQGAVGELIVPPFVVFVLEKLFARNNDVTSGLSYLAKVDNGYIAGTGIGAEDGSMFSGVLLLNATDGSATDFDSTIIMEDETDVNLGQSVTRDNLQAITNDFLVLDTAADLEDNILLEDAIATNEGGGRLLEEDRVIDSFTAFDIQRQSLLDVKDFDTASEFLLTEESEDGGIKLEDATTSGFNDLILEDANDLQYGGRFVLEFNRFAMEDASNDGEVPTGGFASARVEPFTRPSDIFVTDIGTISLEVDEDEYLLINHGGNSELVLDTAADAFSNILLETFHDDTGDIAGHIVLEGDGDSGGFQFQLETGTPINVSTAIFQTPERQRDYSKTANSNNYGEVFTFDSSSLNFSYK